MLQRSPSTLLVPSLAISRPHSFVAYVVSDPGVDTLGPRLRPYFSEKTVYWLVRWRFVFFTWVVYAMARRWPEWTRKRLLRHVQKQLPAHVDISHFAPKYNPWDERCVSLSLASLRLFLC